MFYDRSIINVDITGDGSPESSLASNYQDDVGVNNRSPLSIGAGMSWRLGGEMGTCVIHLSMEWFSGIDEYTVIDTADFTAQTSKQTISNDFTLALFPVLNWGSAFSIFGFQITFGMGYGFGNTSDFILSPIGGVNEDDITQLEPVQATYRYRRLLALIGFAFDL